MRPPRLLLSSPHSSSGKTTVALALIAAWRQRGLQIQPFKVGPDYLDPTHLTALSGRPARNLDGFFLEEAELLEIFRRGMRGAQLALIEGVMGLYDGKDPQGTIGSTAQIAKLLKTPVVLVVEASAMAGSIAALARGFRDQDPELLFAGVIANRVGSAGHAELLRSALEANGIPFLGYLPELPRLPERHLGLLPASERSLDPTTLLQAAQYLQLDALEKIAQSASPLPTLPHKPPEERFPPRGQIAIAQDPAFFFYYPDNLELLEQMGAELVPFSPLEDPLLPPGVSGVYLGGGYPELYARELAQNIPLKEALRQFPGPIYAECGGLIYLSQALRTSEGEFPMVGRIPGITTLETLVIGYREVVALRDFPLALKGWHFKGHEFHIARLPSFPTPAWQRLEGLETEGFIEGQLLASFIHLYLPATPQAARRWVQTSLCRNS